MNRFIISLIVMAFLITVAIITTKKDDSMDDESFKFLILLKMFGVIVFSVIFLIFTS